MRYAQIFQDLPSSVNVIPLKQDKLRSQITVRGLLYLDLRFASNTTRKTQ